MNTNNAKSISENKTRFPQVSGSNLLGEKIRLPQDLKAGYTLLMIAFYQRQQEDINTWLPFVKNLEEENAGFAYLELPVIRSLNPISRWFINQGMAAGIRDPYALARTVTLYVDKREFRRMAGIEREDKIQLLLVNRSGEIVWGTTGRYHEAKEISLLEHIKATNTEEER